MSRPIDAASAVGRGGDGTPPRDLGTPALVVRQLEHVTRAATVAVVGAWLLQLAALVAPLIRASICPDCGRLVGHGHLARHRRLHWCAWCRAYHRPDEGHYQRPVTPGDEEALLGHLARHGFEELPLEPLGSPALPAGFSPRSTGSAGGPSRGSDA